MGKLQLPKKRTNSFHSIWSVILEYRIFLRNLLVQIKAELRVIIMDNYARIVETRHHFNDCTII